MKNRKLLLLGCCVPFAFLALYMDEAFDSAFGYILFLGATVLWGWLCQNTERAMFWWGNILPAAVSVACAWMVYGSRMDGYFKPFGVVGWAVFLCTISLGIQWLVRKREWLVLLLASGGIGAVLLLMYSLQWSI